MPVKLDHLTKLLQEQLKDAYSAESQLLEAIPKMRDAASDRDLRQAFSDHLLETKGHIDRIERACEMLGSSPLGHRCRAMEGLIKEGSEVVNDAEADAEVRDAALICAAQKVEHYEMALYGCIRTYASTLGRDDLASLLQETLDEEGAADKRLTAIAVGDVNSAAATPQPQ
ncbi:MAG: ferritin-like domain-containing protein [Phycisphaerales bacterium]